MGYHSDVVFVVDELKWNSVLYNLNDTQRDIVNSLLSCADDQYRRMRAYLFHWNCIKWYEETSDISAFLFLLKQLEPADYLLLRMGDDLQDTQSDGSFWDNPFNARFVREISFDKEEPLTEMVD